MGREWFSDDEFWTASFPFMFPEESFDEAREQVPKILSLTGVTKGNVLDLGCGPGRHSVPLAKEGFEVTGVDRTAFLLDHARRHAEVEGVGVEWIQEDMRSFRRPEQYDLAISMFTSFGFFHEAEENERVLTNVCTSLRSDGRFVLDVLGKELLARDFVETDVREIEGVGLVFERRRILNDWMQVATDWILIEEATVRTFAIELTIYSAAEVRQMLYGAGFEEVGIYGGFDGRPYDIAAERLIVVGRKG
jgi:SAM-dependent methyltransferase